ncbi:MAG: hypothetical protein KBD31_04800 [Proteobacteria bacterium]|nr:hypothetical protein [Pseudomonadota bacterium]
MMNKKHKVYARLAAVAMTVGMAYSGTTAISAINSDGSLANTTGHLCTINNVAAAAATMTPGIVPDKAALVIHGGALTFTSGGFIQEGGTATIDCNTTGNTILSWYAQKSGNLYVRVATKGTALASQTITSLCFGPNCKAFNVWKCADSTAVTVSNLYEAATAARDIQVVSAQDLPSPAPTQNLGGRTYTLVYKYVN